VHLLALGFLPVAVSGVTFHLLPVMLRNPLRSERRLWLALPLLALGGWLVAPGVALGTPAALWLGAGLLVCGLAPVLVELGGLVSHARRAGGCSSPAAPASRSASFTRSRRSRSARSSYGDAPMLGVTASLEEIEPPPTRISPQPGSETTSSDQYPSRRNGTSPLA
jgi:hypothetical protein